MHATLLNLETSIVTNTRCNLRCSHCYLTDEQLKDKKRMSEKSFILSLEQIAKLAKISKVAESIEIEALGGETTLMPIEWWEKMLPALINQITEIERCTNISDASSSITTNGLFSSPEYIELFNRFSNDHFELMTSFEVDTNRFGKDNRQLGRFYENLRQVGAKKIVLMTLTHGALQMSAEEIAEKVLVPVDSSNLNLNFLISSGSASSNMVELPSMKKISDWVIATDKQLVETGRAPLMLVEDYQDALQTNGANAPIENSCSSITILPDGSTLLSSSQLDEIDAEKPLHPLSIEDPYWSVKVSLENSRRIATLLNPLRKECSECLYYSGCKGGGFYYRELVNTDLDREECIGNKAIWEYAEKKLKKTDKNSTERRMRDFVKRLSDPIFFPEAVLEATFSDSYNHYVKYITHLTETSSPVVIHLSEGDLFGFSLLERVWFYHSLGIPFRVSLKRLKSETEIKTLIRHQVFFNFNCIAIDTAEILSFVQQNPWWQISIQLQDAAAALFASNDQERVDHDLVSMRFQSIYIDRRHELLIGWIALFAEGLVPKRDLRGSLGANASSRISKIATRARLLKGRLGH